MSAPILTFFNNNKSGVGKTSLVYHLAWMYAFLGKRVFIADFDSQANLTAMFLEEERIEEIWTAKVNGATTYQCIKPVASNGCLLEPVPQQISTNLYVLPGDIHFSIYEDLFSDAWRESMGNSNLHQPMRTVSSVWQLLQMASASIQADIVLVDIGSNLGALNRSILIAADFVAIPLGADLFSLQGLKILGPILRKWRLQWQERLRNWTDNKESREYPEFLLPAGKIYPIGYLKQQHGVRLDRPVMENDKWIKLIPNTYREAVLEQAPDDDVQQSTDPYCLASVKYYRSLVPMAQECRKPIFNLTSADGAIGAHAGAVQDAKQDFKALAEKIAAQIHLEL